MIGDEHKLVELEQRAIAEDRYLLCVEVSYGSSTVQLISSELQSPV